VRVADEARRQVDVSVFGVLAVAGALALLKDPVFDRERDLEVRVSAGLGARRYGRVGLDRRAGGGVIDEGPGQADAGERQRQLTGPPPTDRSVSLSLLDP
jgi:hypothetical protein